MYEYFEKDIRNLRTEGIKSIKIISNRAKNAMKLIKYDNYGYPIFLEYTGMYGIKDHYEVCMCRNYYKDNKISRRIVARSFEGDFILCRYVYDNDLLIRAYEFDIDSKLTHRSTTDYEYKDDRLISIDTTYNCTGRTEHISFEYKDNKTTLIYEDCIETVDKREDGKIASYSHFHPTEDRYNFIYKNSTCVGIETGYGFYTEVDIQRRSTE